MEERIIETKLGNIHYWVSNVEEKDTLVFLPGLTADHRLFEKQLEYFKGKYNLLVWDAPGHSASRPFTLEFGLREKAGWLDDILHKEGIDQPILIGQSMGGYVSQAYAQWYPGKMKGFVSIDSAPLQREYMSSMEIAALKHTEGMYRMYPWKALLRDGSKGCAETEYGRELMKEMMLSYDKREYAALVGHGYRILAEAIVMDLPYTIDCPAILICGKEDKAGFTKKYNEKWQEKTGLPIYWIEGAGHNSNSDRPEEINGIIEEFVKGL